MILQPEQEQERRPAAEHQRSTLVVALTIRITANQGASSHRARVYRAPRRRERSHRPSAGYGHAVTAGIDVPLLAQTVALPPPGLTLAAFITALNGQSVGGCGGFPTGQCTALACAWCRNLGLGTPCGACGAPDKCDGVCWSGSGFPGFTWTPYSAGKVPAPGDLVSYHPCSGQDIGASGHVGVFVSGNATSFTGFDQNWNGAYCRLITHSYACVQGWQHPLTSVVIGPPPPPPPPSVVTVGNGLLVGALALGLGAVYLRRNHRGAPRPDHGPPERFHRRRNGSLMAPCWRASPRPRSRARDSRATGWTWCPRHGRSPPCLTRTSRPWRDSFFPMAGWSNIGNVEHTTATQKYTGHRGLGPVLASGVVRWRSDSGDIVFVQLNTPMTAAQLRAVGELQEKYGELIIDVTHTGPLPRDAAPVFTGRSQDRIATWRVLREANAAAGGQARTRTPMSPSAEAARTRTMSLTPAAALVAALPVANSSTEAGFLLPNGTLVNTMGKEHAAAARDHAQVQLRTLLLAGVARWRYNYDFLYLEIGAPLTAAQQRTIREFLEASQHDGRAVALAVELTVTAGSRGFASRPAIPGTGATRSASGASSARPTLPPADRRAPARRCAERRGRRIRDCSDRRRRLHHDVAARVVHAGCSSRTNPAWPRPGPPSSPRSAAHTSACAGT